LFKVVVGVTDKGQIDRVRGEPGIGLGADDNTNIGETFAAGAFVDVIGEGR